MQLRGVVGCTSDIFQYYSLQYLSLADSSVIAYSSPIFVTFVAYFVLGEKIGIVSVFTGIMSLIGVIIISRPPMLTGEESFDESILVSPL
jgi:drug/metabolite transporter (DMT)-like permease